jgi:hypothetical protein
MNNILRYITFALSLVSLGISLRALSIVSNHPIDTYQVNKDQQYLDVIDDETGIVTRYPKVLVSSVTSVDVYHIDNADTLHAVIKRTHKKYHANSRVLKYLNE